MVTVKKMLPWLAFVTTTLLMGCGADTVHLSDGQKAPEFRLSYLDQGDAHFPDDYAGKIVIVRFWADWCPFCETEMTAIEPLYRQYRQQGVVVLALNVRQDRETAAAFIDRLGISYDVLLDQEGETARAYGVIGLPTTFFITREGHIHTKIIGESTPRVFETVLTEML